MFVFDLEDIISILIILIIIIYIFVNSINNKIKKIRKKNCYKCKYYKLYDVASAGGYCQYKCIKKEKPDNICSFNNKEHYEKCKYFEENR